MSAITARTRRPEGTIRTSSTPRTRRALVAIVVAGCLLAPAAVAQPADNGSSVKHPARANVYVPPGGEQATTAGRTYAEEIAALSSEQLAAAYGTAIPQRIPTPASPRVASADDGTSPWLAIGLALGGAALLCAASVTLARRARRAVA